MSAVVAVDELGPCGDNLGNGGEARRVCLLPARPGWLYKEYFEPASPAETDRLDRLIGVPGRMSREDLALAGRHASWPGYRVVNGGGETAGVLLPVAPDSYQYDWKLPGGRTKRKPLEADVLALSQELQARKNLPPQSLDNRIAVCAVIASVGSLFERYGLVYLDWSYANVFWSARDQSAYVIDMDGCSFGPRPQIQQPGWADPLVPFGDAGNACDRYRVALLIARCLTGERGEPASVRSALNALRMHSASFERVVDMLLKTLSAATLTDRPSVGQVSRMLSAAAGAAAPASRDVGGVTGWKPIIPKAPAGTSTRVPSASAPWQTPTTPTPAPTAPPKPVTPVRSGSMRSAGPAGADSGPGRAPYRPPATYTPPSQPVKPSSGSVGAAVTVLFIIAIIVILAFIL